MTLFEQNKDADIWHDIIPLGPFFLANHKGPSKACPISGGFKEVSGDLTVF